MGPHEYGWASPKATAAWNVQLLKSGAQGAVCIQRSVKGRAPRLARDGTTKFGPYVILVSNSKHDWKAQSPQMDACAKFPLPNPLPTPFLD